MSQKICEEQTLKKKSFESTKCSEATLFNVVCLSQRNWPNLHLTKILNVNKLTILSCIKANTFEGQLIRISLVLA